MTTPAPAQQFQAKGLLFSEDACNRHKMGRDAKQLAGKLTASTVTVWKYFNKLETISKMVDSSDSVQRQRAALCRLYFSSADQVYCQEAGNRRQTPEQSPLFLRPPPLGFFLSPAHTNTTLATTKANMCDLLQLAAPGGRKKKKTGRNAQTDPSPVSTISRSAE